MLLENVQWTPAQCAAVPVTVAAALWADIQRPTADPEDLIAALNRRRALQGLPPITAEQAWENERQDREMLKQAQAEAAIHPLTPSQINEKVREYQRGRQ